MAPARPTGRAIPRRRSHYTVAADLPSPPRRRAFIHAQFLDSVAYMLEGKKQMPAPASQLIICIQKNNSKESVNDGLFFPCFQVGKQRIVFSSFLGVQKNTSKSCPRCTPPAPGCGIPTAISRRIWFSCFERTKESMASERSCCPPLSKICACLVALATDTVLRFLLITTETRLKHRSPPADVERAANRCTAISCKQWYALPWRCQ